MADPLVSLLKRIREAHGNSQVEIEACMGLPPDTYRHIERGRRPLPDYRHNLVDWILRFLDCVKATREEHDTIVKVMSDEILREFGKFLRGR
jgi:transcriptional regulator with XRE-family HTH domain